MERAALEDAVLEYEEAGDGEPVVLIHGALVSDSFWPLLRAAELTKRYRLIVYRRRGYGGSTPATEPVSITQQAEDCRGLLNHLGAAPAHVVGHSYGGAIALELALRSPASVSTLALLEPALVVGSSGPAYRASLNDGQRRYREQGAAPVVEDMLRVRWGEDPRASLEVILPGAFDRAIVEARTTFEVEGPAHADWSFGEAEARRIQHPALLVLGERSRTLDPRFEETYDSLLAWLSGAEGFILPAAAHGLHLQNSSGMVQRLRAFLQRHPSA